ncbi:unnamed protein product [Closterium sp. Yama58-4]|nr:unnamed protein product [Closterium sp. Yama58-4]
MKIESHPFVPSMILPLLSFLSLGPTLPLSVARVVASFPQLDAFATPARRENAPPGAFTPRPPSPALPRRGHPPNPVATSHPPSPSLSHPVAFISPTPSPSLPPRASPPPPPPPTPPPPPRSPSLPPPRRDFPPPVSFTFPPPVALLPPPHPLPSLPLPSPSSPSSPACRTCFPTRRLHFPPIAFTLSAHSLLPARRAMASPPVALASRQPGAGAAFRGDGRAADPLRALRGAPAGSGRLLLRNARAGGVVVLPFDSRGERTCCTTQRQAESVLRGGGGAW